jgi:nitrate/nitrite transporter NarK
VRHGQHASVLEALMDLRVWLYAMLYFSIIVCFYGVTFFLPSILKQLSGLRDFEIGLIAAIPYIVAAVTMVLVAMSSDRTGERHLYVAGSVTVGAIGLVLSSMTTQPVLALIALSIAAAGIWGGLGPFWAMPTAYLSSGSSAAGGIALINSIGNLGGFLGPSLVGGIVQRTGSYGTALFTIAGSLVIACALALTLRAISGVSAAPARAA